MLINRLLGAYLSALILIHFLQTTYAQRDPNCNPSSCGIIPNISYPFRLRDDPPNCGDSDPGYEISCENNTPILYLYSQRYYVQTINYNNYTIRLADPTVIINETCSFPQYSVYNHFNRAQEYPYSTRRFNDSRNFRNTPVAQPATFLSCPHPVNYPFYINTTNDQCVQRSDNVLNSSFSATTRYTYIKAGDLNVSDVGDSCTIGVIALISMPLNNYNNITLSEFHESLLYGFELSWFSVVCDDCRQFGYCQWDGNRAVCRRSGIHCTIYSYYFECSTAVYHLTTILYYLIDFCPRILLGLNLALRILIGMPCVLVFLIYKFRRRHLSMFDVIESFLQSQTNLTPIRYSYSEIKKMTRGFREKLGQGGYGSVYKGKLRSGRDVAVKVLSSRHGSSGQDFMNEVATIGRIHHVNVVKLLGFSAEGSKRSLVYDFMPNGSLEKYIFRQEAQISLNWKKKYDIAVGVARGIEYLHRGCDIQILHFDIKPHNILLDDDFTPKISDFGLAKFYSKDKNNSVTLTAARGTIGYVAPELINRFIGRVSYKADVYSFGMMLMETVGLKRDLVENADNSSLHFPYWIYNHLDKWKDIEIGNVDDVAADDDDNDDENITRKMAIVALWCIQMSPDDRPAMCKVVEMLEGEVRSLQIPPQPSYSSQIVQGEDQTWDAYSSNDSIALLSHDISSTA